MDVFNGPQKWLIEEQVIKDPVTGLTLQFEALPEGYCALRIFGDVPHGNREFLFDPSGQEVGSGVALLGPTMPTWHLNLET